MKMFATGRLDVRTTAIVVLACLALGWLSEKQLLAGGGTRSLVVAAVAVCLPLLALVSWQRPLIFPFCLYVALVPFDNLLATGVGDTVTKLLAMAATAILVLRLVLARNAVVPPRAVIAWFALIVWMAATIFWALDQSAAIDQFTRYAQLFLFLAVISIYPADLRDVQPVIYSAIAGACAAALFGVYLFANGAGNTDDRLYVTAGDYHIDPNHFGASLLMPLALAAVIALRARTWPVRLLALIPVGVLIAGLYMAESRGAFTAVGVMFIFLIIFSRFRWQAIVGAVLAVATLPAAFIARMQIAAQSGGNGRLDIWRSAYAALKEHWLLGAGIGNFPTAYDTVYLKVSHQIFHSWHIQAHDLIAQASVELGIFGLLLMLGAWWLQFRDARTLQSTSGFEDIAIALQAGIIGLFVSSLFLDIMWSKYTWLAFLLVALARNALLTHYSQHRRTGEIVP